MVVQSDGAGWKKAFAQRPQGKRRFYRSYQKPRRPCVGITKNDPVQGHNERWQLQFHPF
jgi:hypothetical protein